MPPLYPNRSRRLSRPTAPSCRGGVSSVLRLAQPGPRNSDFAGLAERAAGLFAPVTGWPRLQDAGTSIITPLTPSRELGLR